MRSGYQLITRHEQPVRYQQTVKQASRYKKKQAMCQSNIVVQPCSTTPPEYYSTISIGRWLMISVGYHLTLAGHSSTTPVARRTGQQGLDRRPCWDLKRGYLGFHSCDRQGSIQYNRYWSSSHQALKRKCDNNLQLQTTALEHRRKHAVDRIQYPATNEHYKLPLVD